MSFAGANEQRSARARGGGEGAQYTHAHAPSSARSEYENTPFTNRGVDNTHSSQPSFSVHWLTGTTYLEFADVYLLLSNLLEGADFMAFDYGINRYRKMFVTLGGIKLLCDPADKETMPPVCVVVPGQGCEILGFEKLQELARILKPTRLDLAFDGAPFSPFFLYEQYKQGNVRTRVRNHDYVHPKTNKAKHWSIERNPNGDTFYLGSKASTWYLCAYDERGWTRLELRLSGERAELAYEALIGDAEQFKQTSLGWLREFCDFVDAKADSNKARAPLLSFWSEFIGSIERVKMSLAAKVADTLEKTVNWIHNQVSASLVIYFKLGHSLQSLLELGESNIRDRHRALLAMVGCT